MRSCPIEVGHIPIEHALELRLVKDEQVVKAFLSYAPQEALADRIGSGDVIGCVKKLNRACRSHPSETRSKFAIVITNKILRCLPIRRGFSQLLRHPGIGRRPCDTDMDYPSGLERDDETCEKRPKEEIRDL
jgi:hypothetical protein